MTRYTRLLAAALPVAVLAWPSVTQAREAVGGLPREPAAAALTHHSDAGHHIDLDRAPTDGAFPGASPAPGSPAQNLAPLGDPATSAPQERGREGDRHETPARPTAEPAGPIERLDEASADEAAPTPAPAVTPVADGDDAAAAAAGRRRTTGDRGASTTSSALLWVALTAFCGALGAGAQAYRTSRTARPAAPAGDRGRAPQVEDHTALLNRSSHVGFDEVEGSGDLDLRVQTAEHRTALRV